MHGLDTEPSCNTYDVMLNKTASPQKEAMRTQVAL